MIRAIESSFPFEEISEVAEIESWRKEVHRPIYHMHKWWARRLGSVFRAVILGASQPVGTDIMRLLYEPVNLNGLVVFDPFMGSGTTVGEAHKLGCTAIGRDINPVAYRLVKTALSPLSQKRLLSFIGNYKDMLRLNCGSFTPALTGTEASAMCCTTSGSKYCPVRFASKRPISSLAISLLGTLIRNALLRCRLYVLTVARYLSVPMMPFLPHVLNATYASTRTTGQRKAHGSSVVDVASYFLLRKLLWPKATRLDIASMLSCSFRERRERLFVRHQCRQRGVSSGLRPTRWSEPDSASCGNHARAQHPASFKLRVSVLGRDVQPTPVTGADGPGQWDQQLPACPERDALMVLFSGVLEFNNMFASYKGEGTGAVRHMFAHHILKPERTPIEANVWGTSKSSGAFSTLFESRLMRAIHYKEAPSRLRSTSKTARKPDARCMACLLRSQPTC